MTTPAALTDLILYLAPRYEEESMTEERALALAQAILADHGDHAAFTAAEVMQPWRPSPSEPPRYPWECGRRVVGQGQKLRVAQVFIPSHKRAAEARAKVEAARAAEARTRARRAQAALAAAPDLPERQAEAYALVEVEGLSQAEAARRMGIAAPNLYKLLKKARLRVGGNESAESARQGRSTPIGGDSPMPTPHEYLTNVLTLDADDAAEAAGLPIDYVLDLVEQGHIDTAAVGEAPAVRFRAHAVATLLLVDELAAHVCAGTLTPNEAGQAYAELRPRLPDAFAGLVAGKYDRGKVDVTVNAAAGPVRLRFLELAWARFVVWVLRPREDAAVSK